MVSNVIQPDDVLNNYTVFFINDFWVKCLLDKYYIKKFLYLI